MTITRVEKLVYGVADMDAGTRYFTDWGLKRENPEGGHPLFRTRTNQEIELRSADDPSLPPSPDPAPSTLRGAIWGVRDSAGLKALADDLSRDRDVREDADGTVWTTDESGNAVGLAVSSPVKADVGAFPVNRNDDKPRMNIQFEPAKQANPIRIGHVVYAIRLEDREKAVSFYLDRLQFRLSDSTKTGGDFMRCAGGNDHHNLFLISRADRNAFDHASFELENFDTIMMGGKYMKQAGWEADTTPGRHILGSNYYWYFRNPCGGKTEYFADMDQMDDNWEPRIWEESPGFSFWSLEEGAVG